ncbi:acetate--CoA ligase family protein [Gymnodinialimonas ceratoperidinii]|uniref:Acetate--CoA ligase family protein n=1 Tax=Gymnodinialimonas ceratoperidinii TaxID=2856823 RepID=A0A8F6YDG0_9RHOB|nr:acetate--CoA ligase family protein [Gymnodinialimonas ceratoperidinii]QXT40420.1 acetate--CoA ligase family protein [Gymnodinialimonas ceratoperidinii]
MKEGRSLDRLLRPGSIAVIGGGAWCESVIRECRKIGFEGEIWPVHPTKPAVAGVDAFASVAELPGAPDAAFVGVNRHATVEVIAALASRGAGGAICFASGFSEAVEELAGADDLQASLLDAAGDMPILGPNCYGLVNALDGVALWPDHHGTLPVARGVALVTQSSNIAINLTMQTRGLPLAYVVTAGNQAQTDLAQIGMALLDDPRVTALGLHIEGIRDIRALEALAEKARAMGKPVVALKVGASDQAQAATVSHTASLAGSDAGARALLARLGIGQVSGLPALLEVLKLLHVTGPLPSNRIASMSCSGGEACLMADTAMAHDVVYPGLSESQRTALRAALGPKVALANPLDYHTYIWADRAAMAACFTAMMDESLALGLVVLDFPRPDRCPAPDWDLVIDAISDAQAASGRPIAVLSSLPDTMPEATARALIDRGIVPLSGFTDALEAVAVAARLHARTAHDPVLLPGPEGATDVLGEADGKACLAAHGVEIPQARLVETPEDAEAAAASIGGSIALKGVGFAHKTEAGAVRLNLSAETIGDAARAMGAGSFLVEEMIDGPAIELLIGVTRDPAHGFVLTLGAGGTLTEILDDTTHLLLPCTEDDISVALSRLRLAPRLAGYRAAPPADVAAIVRAVLAVQDYVIAEAADTFEVEINPLLCTPNRAVAVDALIRKRETP